MMTLTSLSILCLVVAVFHTKVDQFVISLLSDLFLTPDVRKKSASHIQTSQLTLVTVTIILIVTLLRYVFKSDKSTDRKNMVT